MKYMALPGILSAGVWWIFFSGAVWIVTGVCLGIRQRLAYRRRVTVPAKMASRPERVDGMHKILFKRQPLADERELVAVKTKKTLRFSEGATVQISYDPKSPHEAYLADEYPRHEHWKVAGLVCGIGLIPILYSTLRWGL
ncbi:DUF3592 domain-containing protein [Streptomyces sp. NPDC057654]|uniref:DUF3592 domain-containing protein n=1 Tax=Streptomyces sp. NPDC057654 TaxID=3346196 RepID=UPI0036C6F706